MSGADSGNAALLTEALMAGSPDLLRYLERRLGADDAADALADVMVTAWRRIDDLPLAVEEARMWLFGVARNVAANAQRGERRRWALADRLRSMLASDKTTSVPADDGTEVRDAITRLDAELAELIKLVHWDGFSVSEAAFILDIPPSTARGRYQRAKEQLRASLSLPQAYD